MYNYSQTKCQSFFAASLCSSREPGVVKFCFAMFREPITDGLCQVCSTWMPGSRVYQHCGEKINVIHLNSQKF